MDEKQHVLSDLSSPIASPEKNSFSSSPHESLDGVNQFDKHAVKKLNRKLDLRVIPPIVTLWFWAFIDRVNMGSAAIFGLQTDLHMNGNQFNYALCMFFVSFIIFETPSTLVLSKRWLSPSTWICAQVFILSCFTIGEGLVHSTAALVGMRWFLGMFEAGLVPCAVFLLAQYYPRFDLQWRLNLLFIGNALSGAFGGLLAYAIAGLSGDNGWKGWRWIFIIEGAITAGIALIFKFVVVDLPENSKFLNNQERETITARIVQQAGAYKMDRFDGPAIRRTFLDWKIWINVLTYTGSVAVTYAINLFSPTIVAGLNPSYSPRHVQALVIPIFVVSAVLALITAFVSDHFKHRTAFAFFGYGVSLIGLIIFLNQHHVTSGVRYFALYLVSGGTYITLPLLWTLMINNVAGRHKTAIATSMQIGVGNIGGIVASLVFQKKDAPGYAMGYWVIFAMQMMAIVGLATFILGLKWENKQRDAGKRDHRYQDKDLDNMGDDHPAFRFNF